MPECRNTSWKFFSPTQAEPDIPATGLNLTKAIEMPHSGYNLSRINKTAAGINRKYSTQFCFQAWRAAVDLLCFPAGA